MNRDPNNNECTRDPIFLFQVAIPKWTQVPDGLESDGESWYVTEIDDVEGWVLEFLDEENQYIDSEDLFTEAAEKQENDHGWPLVYLEWRTETVFLTREEGEAHGKAHAYRWWKWRVYCVPCDGALAKILENVGPQLPPF